MSVNNQISAGVQPTDPSYTKYALVDREGRNMYPNYVIGGTFRERQVAYTDYNGGAADQTLPAAAIAAGTVRINNIVGNANLKMPTVALLNQALGTFVPPLSGVVPINAVVAGQTNTASPERTVEFSVWNPDAADTVTLIASGATPGTDITVGIGSMAVAPNTTAKFEIVCINTAGSYTYTVNRV